MSLGYEVPAKEAHVENFFYFAGAAFLGAFLANVLTRMLFGARDAGAGTNRPRHSRGFALSASAIFTIVAGLSLYFVTVGELAPIMAAIIAGLALAILSYVGRALQRPAVQQEDLQ